MTATGTTFDLTLAPGRPPVAHATGDPAEHRAAVDAVVAEHGAVLLRGLGVGDLPSAAATVAALTTATMPEHEPFSPRARYLDNLYSGAEWPSNQPMCLHHELSYARTAPSRLVLVCLTAPDEGGAVPLADGADVLADLPADLVDRFDRHGWELRRAHNGVVGVDWPAAFGTDDRDEVRRYCADNDVECAWDDRGVLRTRRVRPAVLRHPVTGRRTWFNQVAFLNEWTMDPTVRDYLVAEFGEDELPFTTRCGDGTPLDRGAVDAINEVYAAHTVREPWQRGDVLVVDNLRMAHGRDAYQGERRIAVALADPAPISRS